MDEEARDKVDGMTDAMRSIADSLKEDEAVETERAILGLWREDGLIEVRHDAMREIVDSWVEEVSLRSFCSLKAVSRVFGAAKERVLRQLAKAPTMPAGVNYVDRYAAFLRMDDSRELVMRLEQTLDTADKVMARIARVDVDAALTDAAAGWARCVAPLTQVKVVKSSDALVADVAGPVASDAFRRLVNLRSREACVATAVVERSFTGHAGEAGSTDAIQRGREDLETTTEVEAAFADAMRAVDERRRAMGREAAGSGLDSPDLDAIVTTATVESIYPPEELARLSAAVRASFAIYRRVVNDQGVFGAFSREDRDIRRGMPDGRDWALGCSSEEPVELPTMVEVEGKETIFEVIERIEVFNKRPYHGIFDDDFAEHVEAFWYAFGRLMIFVNTAVRVDAGRFLASLVAAQAPVMESAETLGSLMDFGQLEDFMGRLKRIEEEIEQT